MTTRSPINRTFSINDKSISVYEWPVDDSVESSNTKESHPIVLLHATGFHARCWDQIIHNLPNVPIFAIDALCHGKSDSIDPPYDWHRFAEYTEALIVELGLTNITGVGHSFGGHLLTLLIANRPELFHHALLLDPVIGDPEHIKLWQQAAQTDSPVANRRNQWASSEELGILRKKVPFNTWDPQVFADYCQYGLSTEKTAEGYTLACPPKCEAAIYGIVGGEDTYGKLPHIHTPITIIRAKERTASDAIFDFRPSPTWNKLVDQFPNAQEVYCENRTHFFPMEDPLYVAKMIKEIM